MIRRTIITLAACASLLAVAAPALAASGACTPTFRVNGITQVSRSGCVYTYQIDAICNASGTCGSGNCFPSNALTWAWTVTQTGGSGSVTVDRTDWLQINVTVTPPVRYDLSCTVGGCSACCVVPYTHTCMSEPVSVPSRTSSLKNVNIQRACP